MYLQLSISVNSSPSFTPTPIYAIYFNTYSLVNLHTSCSKLITERDGTEMDGTINEKSNQNKDKAHGRRFSEVSRAARGSHFKKSKTKLKNPLYHHNRALNLPLPVYTDVYTER